MLGRHDRRVAMISGANRGIGAAIATTLGEAGWCLSLGVRDPAKVPAEIAAGETLCQSFDAREGHAEAGWVAATVERFGRIDAVVNNAGIMIPKSVIEAEDEEIDRILEVNVKSPLRLVRAAWPYLAASGRGRVVTIVSLAGKRLVSARSGLYGMSKFAALGLVHAIRHAGDQVGVRSTAICPSYVATDMARGLTDMDPAEMTRPEDIARLVKLVLELPNSANVAEIPVNWKIEASF